MLKCPRSLFHDLQTKSRLTYFICNVVKIIAENIITISALHSAQHSNSFAVMALKSFIRPSKLAISWFNSSVEVLGANRWISSDECATIGPDCCKRFVNVFVNDIGGAELPATFLYGEEFCGRIVTAGTENSIGLC